VNHYWPRLRLYRLALYRKINTDIEALQRVEKLRGIVVNSWWGNGLGSVLMGFGRNGNNEESAKIGYTRAAKRKEPVLWGGDMKEFPPFALDSGNQCLWRQADAGKREPVVPTPKTFAVLQYLVEHAGPAGDAR
jgi:hypothetical protein